jgi:hypothetical protein
MLRAVLPLLLALAACTPADPPMLIDESKAPATAASDEPRTAGRDDPATPAAND